MIVDAVSKLLEKASFSARQLTILSCVIVLLAGVWTYNRISAAEKKITRHVASISSLQSDVNTMAKSMVRLEEFFKEEIEDAKKIRAADTARIDKILEIYASHSHD